MSIELKIKAISLADEARTIKHFEYKYKHKARMVRLEEEWADNADDEFKKQLKVRRDKAMLGFSSLRNHRVGPLRCEARATNVARGFIRGLPYEAIELGAKTPPDWKAVARMVSKYADPELQSKLTEWSSK